jgi:SAM-dependent methyltransferase
MPSSSISDYHASDAAAYHRFLGRWTERLARIFADFAGLPSNGDVLDIGCGTGNLAAEIAQRAPGRRVVGLDASDAYVAYAREHHRRDNLSFMHGDAAALKFHDREFAATLAQLVLTFVPEPGHAAAEMVRVTRPGGIVAAAVWDFCGGLVYQRMFWDTAAALDVAAGRARDRLFSHPLSDPNRLQALWQSVGLDGVKTGELHLRMDYANFDDYWEPLLGGQGPVGAFVASMRSDALPKLKDAVRSAYLSGRPDGPRSLSATAWAVHGIVP